MYFFFKFHTLIVYVQENLPLFFTTETISHDVFSSYEFNLLVNYIESITESKH